MDRPRSILPGTQEGRTAGRGASRAEILASKSLDATTNRFRNRSTRSRARALFPYFAATRSSRAILGTISPATGFVIIGRQVKKNPPKKPANKTKPGWKRILGGTFYALFILCAFGAGTIGGWISRSPMMMALAQQIFVAKDPSEVFGNKKHLTILMMGVDVDLKTVGVRYVGNKVYYKKEPIPGSGRADMILVARLDFENNTITGVSIPRDTLCRLPGYRRQKINAYYRFNRKESKYGLMREAVEDTLPGVKIDRTVSLNYSAFEEIVNDLGGVWIDVKKPMKYDDYFGNIFINFKPGMQKMNGHDSLLFVRFRHTDSDFERQARQKQFLMAMKTAMMQNIAKFPVVLEKSVSLMDEAFTRDEMASVAYFAKNVKQADIQMGRIETLPIRRSTDLRVDQAKLLATLREYKMIEDPAAPHRNEAND